ncbi:hypothetical protein M9H77_30215 [Catharanthus roseus]|uniref:Uncharacterized protein n=1 Tax=Catharanthus roseus TaxID=4058 RepID=A0ACB9ZYW4_CATRO|nr:hypothetical protein M9H77_30215 [Catharanthus roseus]
MKEKRERECSLGSLSESRHITAVSTPKFKRTCNVTVGIHGQSPDPQNEAIETKFRYLIVNTSQTPYECSITNNCTAISLVKTGYRLLGHLPGLPWDQPLFQAPPDSLLGSRTPPQSMMRCPCKPIGPHTPRSTPSSTESTLLSLKRPRHQKRPLYMGLATYSVIL